MDIVNTLIIGAGPSGLACAACLKKRGIEYILLEKNDHLAETWRNQYDRLHLHTDKYSSYLPFVKFPASAPLYPSRDDVVEYLESYADKFALNPRLSQNVKEISKNGEWQVRTEDQTYYSKNVIIATGMRMKPYFPSWKGMETFKGPLFHSSEYENGKPFKGKDVLVIGFGNSACEIALCLYEHGARPSLSVRNPVNILPRDILGIPIVQIGRLESILPDYIADFINKPVLKLIIGEPENYGLRKASYGPISQINKFQKIPLLDVGTLSLIKKGNINVFNGINRIHDNEVIFEDGRTQRFDTIIAATGFRPAFQDILNIPGFLNEEERLPESGKEINDTGLFFCGFNGAVPAGMLMEIRIEAKKISASIVKKSIN